MHCTYVCVVAVRLLPSSDPLPTNVLVVIGFRLQTTTASRTETRSVSTGPVGGDEQMQLRGGGQRLARVPGGAIDRRHEKDAAAPHAPGVATADSITPWMQCDH
jgi:hypothetical protein